MEGHKRMLNRIMGTTSKTIWENYPEENPKHRQPNRQQLVLNDIQRRAHKIPPPMPILPSQIDTPQGNKK